MLRPLRDKPIRWNKVSRIGLIHLLSTTLLTGSAFAYTLPFEKGTKPTKTVSVKTQEIIIEGKIVASDGSGALPGVSVILKGSAQGTTTDENGTFRITVPSPESILIFSFVGYESQEVLIGNRSVLSISLKADTKALEELVVVGYGTQKKMNLTGAVDQVTSKVLENRSLPNLAQGLQGVIPNLNLVMGDGKPTQSPAYNIRGATSIGSGGSALV
jgi:hypothetical protein